MKCNKCDEDNFIGHICKDSPKKLGRCTKKIYFGNGHQSSATCILTDDGKHEIHCADGYSYGWLYWKNTNGELSFAGYSGEGLVDYDEFLKDQKKIEQESKSPMNIDDFRF